MSDTSEPEIALKELNEKDFKKKIEEEAKQFTDEIERRRNSSAGDSEEVGPEEITAAKDFAERVLKMKPFDIPVTNKEGMDRVRVVLSAIFKILFHGVAAGVHRNDETVTVELFPDSENFQKSIRAKFNKAFEGKEEELEQLIKEEYSNAEKAKQDSLATPLQTKQHSASAPPPSPKPFTPRYSSMSPTSISDSSSQKPSASAPAKPKL